MKKLLFLLNLFAVLLLMFACPTPAGAQAGSLVRVSPFLITLQPGDTAAVEIWVDDVAELYGFAIEIHFDPAYLSAGSLALGDFLVAGSIVEDSVDNANGIIRFDMTQFNPSEPEDGSGVLITFEITLLEVVGETNLRIDSVLLTDRNGFEIPCDVEDGIVSSLTHTIFLPLVIR